MIVTINTNDGSTSWTDDDGTSHRVAMLTRDETLWQVACLLMGQPGFREDYKEDK